MFGQSYFPCPALREYVKTYQLWHFHFPPGTDLPFKPYAPRPEQSLVFCVRGFEKVEHPSANKLFQRPRSYFMGQYIERTNRHIGTEEFLAIIVNFQPGALYRITGMPNHELANRFIDAEAFVPKEIRMLNERLSSIADYKEIITQVETFLLKWTGACSKSPDPVDRVCQMIIEEPGDKRLLPMARESFLSWRQFERRFRERMGVNPKLFTRIARTNKAFRMKYMNPGEDWLTISLACGYHDYQHLVRDFHHFAATTPTTYLSEDMNTSPESYFGMRDSSL